jgi:hypothetical protein
VVSVVNPDPAALYDIIIIICHATNDKHVEMSRMPIDILSTLYRRPKECRHHNSNNFPYYNSLFSHNDSSLLPVDAAGRRLKKS